MQKVSFTSYSERLWDISPPKLKDFKRLLIDKDYDFTVHTTWAFNRAQPQNKETAKGNMKIRLEHLNRQILYKMVTGEIQSIPLEIRNILP